MRCPSAPGRQRQHASRTREGHAAAYEDQAREWLPWCPLLRVTYFILDCLLRPRVRRPGRVVHRRERNAVVAPVDAVRCAEDAVVHHQK